MRGGLISGRNREEEGGGLKGALISGKNREEEGGGLRGSLISGRYREEEGEAIARCISVYGLVSVSHTWWHHSIDELFLKDYKPNRL